MLSHAGHGEACSFLIPEPGGRRWEEGCLQARGEYAVRRGQHRFGGIGPVIVLLAAFILTSCSETYFPEPEEEGGWRKNIDPDFLISLGLNPKGVDNYLAYNLLTGHATSALVIKDGWIVGEWYKAPELKEQKIYVASVAKAFTLASFGIAVKEGAEGRLPVALNRSSKLYDPRWLTAGYPLSDPRKAEITFDQVFRHTAGFAHESLIDEGGRDQWSDYESWVVGRDPQWPETKRLIYPPGRPGHLAEPDNWGDQLGSYSSLGFAHIGLILQQLYNMPARDVLWERLLQPIGFSGIDFYKPPAPPSLMWFSGAGLKMTTRDLGRFAYFMVNDGTWKNRRLLPEGWVDSFVNTPYYPNLRSNVDGYFGDNYPKDLFRMFGSGGNFVFVVPSMNLIAIRTGHANNFFMEKIEHDLLYRVFDMLIAYRPLG